ncbi:UNVERIFIED_CONTAM: hypothetical protein FKN15_056750 [Acipenser sinensis]
MKITEGKVTAFMDIGETFNHLIPSDQLDDTLLLGPNLESEVGDEFGTGHNLEDSLKKMLSDKDPMLGSASSQFHLLDNDDANFQTTGSTVVGLEDIMYEGELKESGHDIIEEEDLMLPGKSQRGRSVNAALQSPRKSPRLMAQEPVRSLRQSTLARRCSPSNTLKKSPAKELQVLLGYAGRNKHGRKHELLTKALHLLKAGCSPAVQMKIKELYRRRFPNKMVTPADLSSLSVHSTRTSLSSGLSTSGIPQLTYDGHTATSMLLPVSLLGPKHELDLPHLTSALHPVHPDVKLQKLPFYDMLDELIKPTSLGIH